MKKFSNNVDGKTRTRYIEYRIVLFSLEGNESETPFSTRKSSTEKPICEATSTNFHGDRVFFFSFFLFSLSFFPSLKSNSFHLIYTKIYLSFFLLISFQFSIVKKKESSKRIARKRKRVKIHEEKISPRRRRSFASTFSFYFCDSSNAFRPRFSDTSSLPPCLAILVAYTDRICA